MANRNSVGILAIDPGVTTGCAAGLFDLRQPTVAACMRRARAKRNLTSWEVGGSHVSQAWEIARWFTDWQFKTHVEQQRVFFGNYYIVVEDFIPRQLNFEPASMFIIGGIETLLAPKIDVLGFHGDRQQPGQKWADDQWLKQNNLWVSSQHERDARRHIAAKLDLLLG